MTSDLLRTQEGWTTFWLDVPESTRRILLSHVEDMERSFVTRRNLLKSSWHNIDAGTRRRAYTARLLLDLRQLYVRALERIGKSNVDIAALSIPDRMRLVTHVPPLDVEVTLATQHQQQWDRPEEPNDIRDVSHLCMAVPYCDVVVTERYWIDKLQRSGLAAKYNTRLLHNLCDLPTTLEKLCP